MARTDEFVTEVRADAAVLLSTYLSLKGKQLEWNALDYGNTLPNTQGLTAADIGAVVFAAMDAFETVLNTGVATNIAKVL